MIRKVLDAPPSTDISFKQRIQEFTNAVITDIRSQVVSEQEVSETVQDTFDQIIKDFHSSCNMILEATDIPDTNRTVLDQQQQTQVECGYLSRKLQLLEEIYSGYREEKKAWEENIEFFKNPLSLTTVTMKDCAFENLNDVTTLSSVYDHCGELLSLLRSIKETKEEVFEARQGLVEAYQDYILKAWRALEVPPTDIEDNLQPPRQSIL